VLDGNPAPPPQKKGTVPQFRPMPVVAKRLDGSRCHLVEVDLRPGDIVLDGDTAPPTERGTATTPTFGSVSVVAKRSPISATAELLFLFVYEISREPLNGFAPLDGPWTVVY